MLLTISSFENDKIATFPTKIGEICKKKTALEKYRIFAMNICEKSIYCISIELDTLQIFLASTIFSCTQIYCSKKKKQTSTVHIRNVVLRTVLGTYLLCYASILDEEKRCEVNKRAHERCKRESNAFV